ncbi:MAG: response regulator [Thermomicrobiales bacterium]
MKSDQTRPHSSALERPHVLIVSDDQGLAEFLTEGLVYGGFWTSVVASGIQTLELFRLRSFDLILIDAALQGLSATDVIRRLRFSSDASQDGPRTDVPILIIAAAEEEAPMEEMIDAGANGRLVAPLDLDHLVPKLHAVVAKWRREHPGRPFADEAAQRSSDHSSQ